MAGLFSWGARRPEEPPARESPVEATATSVVLPKFLAALAQRQAPVIVDLGPVVGATVSFFGERLACKLLIADLQSDLIADGARSAADRRDAMLARLEATVTAPLDGILCWDVFDYLDRQTAQAVAAFLTGRLASGAVVHGMFGTTPGELTQRTRYVVQSATTLSCRPEPIRSIKRTVLSTRDLAGMFAGLRVVESVLLKNQRRETLLRKA